MRNSLLNDSRAEDTGRGHGSPLRSRAGIADSAFRRTYYDRWPKRRRVRDAGPSERSTSEMRPRLHSFGGAGAFLCAPSELRASAPVVARPFGG
ncbi:unnamed protein product [Colias eurytheme]|nr:unnamed protein product [Colias eurytheme]